MGAFLPISALPGLKKYKYASEDRSLISKYILKPFYTRLVEYLPRSLAPNMVTLLGLLFSVISFFLALYYNPGLNSYDTPRWVFLVHAFNLFMYQTLDALDGLQARRTGTSSPLGELFDHCVDAINTSLQAYVVATVVNFSPRITLLSQFMCTTNFFLSTWEEYHTHKLFLSAFSGPVEGIIMLIVAEIATAIYGPELWSVAVPGSSFTVRDISIFGSAVGLLSNSLGALSNVRKAVKGPEFWSTLTGIVPFLTLWVGIGLFARVAWNDIQSGSFLPFFLTAAFTFALLVGRIITAHVTNQSYPMWTPLLFAHYCGLVLHFINPGLEQNSIWWAFGLSVGIYGSFIAEIIAEICSYLDIGCLYIKEKPKTD